MPRRPDIERYVLLNLSLPETLRAKLDVILFSPSEGRVPHGAYRTFFIKLLNDYFDQLEYFAKLEAKSNEHSEPR